MINWTHIMIHHSLTKDSETVSWGAIRKYHTRTLGWADIGYHFGIERLGSDYEALLGRPLDMKGAHCKEGGMNEKAIGICLVGNFDLVPPPNEALKVLRDRLLSPLMRIHNIPPSNIVFHRDYATYKSCPGNLFTKELLYRYTPGGIV